jgi:uncharacterized membrane protein
MDWFILALISFFLYGIQGFLVKIAAEKKCNSFIVTFSFMFVVTLMSLSILISKRTSLTDLSPYLLFLAIVNGSLYSLDTIGKLESLKGIQASIVFPFVRMSTIMVVVWALLFAGESLSLKSLAGISFSLVAIYLLESEVKR